MDLVNGLGGYLIIIWIILSVLGDMFNFKPTKKILEIITFGRSKQDKKTKLENITDSTPEDKFNILEVDPNTGHGFFKEGATVENNGYVLNPEITPINIKNPIKINTPFRIFQKGLSRDLTGFLHNPNYKLNPSAPEIKRLADMKILKAFLAITKKNDDTLIKIMLILVAGSLIYLYKLSGDIKTLTETVNILVNR